MDPTVRLKDAAKWPLVQALVAARLWDAGIGYLVIARREAEGRLVYGVYLVDVLCLGVKNAFWSTGTTGDFKEVFDRMAGQQPMVPISPAALVKILAGAVEYAGRFGFRPHHDYRHAERLLAGIDPSECTEEFTFGRDGKPFYIQGPFESLHEARAITERVLEAGGHYIVLASDSGLDELDGDFDDEDEEHDRSQWLSDSDD
jgi:hypothetical protein